jgi:hypothetical protein
MKFLSTPVSGAHPQSSVPSRGPAAARLPGDLAAVKTYTKARKTQNVTAITEFPPDSGAIWLARREPEGVANAVIFKGNRWKRGIHQVGRTDTSIWLPDLSRRGKTFLAAVPQIERNWTSLRPAPPKT